jgi:hypothetical protein
LNFSSRFSTLFMLAPNKIWPLSKKSPIFHKNSIRTRSQSSYDACVYIQAYIFWALQTFTNRDWDLNKKKIVEKSSIRPIWKATLNRCEIRVKIFTIVCLCNNFRYLAHFPENYSMCLFCKITSRISWRRY